MQRKNKFRVWNKVWKCMYYLAGFKLAEKKYIQLYYLDQDGDNTTCTVLLKNIILMQYTGLKDKNGKEVYEGDIVSDGVFNYIIKWIDFGFWKIQIGQADKYKCGLFNMEYMTIMGSIYENPELLEQVKLIRKNNCDNCKHEELPFEDDICEACKNDRVTGMPTMWKPKEERHEESNN